MRLFTTLLITSIGLLLGSASSSAVPLAPVITGYTVGGNCISPGTTFLINGRNLGKATGKQIVLGGHGISLPLNVFSWKPRQIKAQLPISSRLTPGQWYYTGIRQVSPVKWLSNISQRLTLCASTVKPKSQQTLTLSLSPFTRDIVRIPPLNSASSTPGITTPPQGAPNNSLGGGADYSSGADWGYYDSGGYTQDNSGQLIGSGPPADFTPLNDKGTQNGDPESIEPGEIMVASSSMEDAQALAQQVESMGLRIKRRKSLGSLGMIVSVFHTPEGVTATQILPQLHEAFPKIWMDVNHRFNLQGGNKLQNYSRELLHWHKGVGRCTSSVRVGMVDSFVDTRHPALQGASIQTHAFTGRGMTAAPAEHGTVVAALMIGQVGSDFTGLAPQVQLYAAEVFRQRDDRHIDATVEQILKGLDWLGSQHVQVVNLSFGGSRNMLLELGLRQLMQQDISIVAAAGNTGPNGTAIYPAAQKGVIAVTAVDAKSQLYRKASRGSYVDFSAPGVDMWAASGKGRYVSGTSYAAPFVTIAMATVRTSEKSALKQRFQFLKIHSIDLGSPGRDSQFGWGIIDFANICKQ